MKEILKALVAGIGCTPLLAVSLFVFGALINQIISIEIPTPPRWLVVLIALFPVCFGLYMRALLLKAGESQWLERWRQARQQKLVGRGPLPMVEEVWLSSQIEQGGIRSSLDSIFGDVTVWGVAALLTFLPLAYVCLWYALLVTGQP